MTDEEAARIAVAVENLLDGVTVTLTNSVRALVDAIREQVDKPEPTPFGTTTTVGYVRKLIANVPDDTLVVLDDGQGWYVHVGEIKYDEPDGDGYTEWPCFTLFRGATFDPRDL